MNDAPVITSYCPVMTMGVCSAQVWPRQRTLVLLPDGCVWRPRVARWGLVPAWVERSGSYGPVLSEVTLETARAAPEFCKAYARRHCVAVAGGLNGKRSRELVYLAGIYERRWEGWRESWSFALLLRSENSEVGPVCLEASQLAGWLDLSLCVEGEGG